MKPIPDLSVEVVFTSGGVSKLTRYQALGVPEVWFWQDGTLQIYRLRTDGYERLQCSEFLEFDDLGLELLKRCILQAETDTGKAYRIFARAVGVL
ncbi:MAG: Uma2 family endonuclease [Cyanobacteria bacterium J06648_16]